MPKDDVSTRINIPIRAGGPGGGGTVLSPGSGAASTLGGYTASEFARLAEAGTITGPWTFNTNITLGSGITVDGMDPSAVKAASFVTMDAEASLSGETQASALAGTGIEWSSSTYRIAAAAAGAGLTGGGGSALAVGAGNGIAVAADSIAVDLVAAWSGLEFDDADLRIALDAAFTWAALHTFNAGVAIDGTLEFQGPESVTTTAGDVTLAPAGNTQHNPTGNHVNPATAYDINLGSRQKPYLTGWFAELWAQTLVAEETVATIHGSIMVTPTTFLTEAITTASSVIKVAHNEMLPGDTALLKAQFRIEFMSIDYGPELVADPGFESTNGPGGSPFVEWSDGCSGDGQLIDDTDVEHGGDHCLNCHLTDGTAATYQAVTVTARTRYRLTFWTMGDDAFAGFYEIYDSTNSNDIVAETSTGVTAMSWTQITVDFTTPTDCVLLRVYLGITGASFRDAYFDDVSLKLLYSKAANLLSNDGFETAGAGGADIWANWTESASDGALANETVLIHRGDDAAKVTAGGSVDTQVNQAATVTAGRKYKLSFWTRGGDATNQGRYRIYDNTNTADIAEIAPTGVASTTYTLVEHWFMTPAECVSVQIYLYCPATDTKIAYYDDVAVQLSQFTYNVTRNKDGTGANAWDAGTAVVNTGNVGDGFIDVYSRYGVKSTSEEGPTIVGNVRNSTTYNDWTEHWAIGNLNGIYGYAATIYGVGLGKYEDDFITIESTNGIRMYNNNVLTVQLLTNADLILGQVATDKANLFWDQSEGTLSFRGGTDGTACFVKIDTDAGMFIATAADYADTRSYSFKDSSSNIVATLSAFSSATANYGRLGIPGVADKHSYALMSSEAPATYQAVASITATSGVAANQAYIYLFSDSDASPNSYITFYVDNTLLLTLEGTTTTLAGGLNVGTTGAGTGAGHFKGDLIAGVIAHFWNDGDANDRYGILIRCGKYDASGDNHILLAETGDGTSEGYLTIDDGVFELNQASDRRRKKDLVLAAPVLDRLRQVEVTEFSFRDKAPGVRHTGYVAQQLHEHFPMVGKHNKDTDWWGVLPMRMIPFNTKGIQELDSYRLDADAERKAILERLAALETA